MEDSNITRRTAGKFAAVGIATLGLAASLRPNSANAMTTDDNVAPGAPGSRWLLFVPDSNLPSITVLSSAVDATGITHAVATADRLTLSVETMRSAYSIVITFAGVGKPADTMTKILSGQLRDLRDKAKYGIQSIKIKDPTAASLEHVDAAASGANLKRALRNP